jgi:hypothetical protein
MQCLMCLHELQTANNLFFCNFTNIKKVIEHHDMPIQAQRGDGGAAPPHSQPQR